MQQPPLERGFITCLPLHGLSSKMMCSSILHVSIDSIPMTQIEVALQCKRSVHNLSISLPPHFPLTSRTAGAAMGHFGPVLWAVAAVAVASLPARTWHMGKGAAAPPPPPLWPRAMRPPCGSYVCPARCGGCCPCGALCAWTVGQW